MNNSVFNKPLLPNMHFCLPSPKALPLPMKSLKIEIPPLDDFNLNSFETPQRKPRKECPKLIRKVVEKVDYFECNYDYSETVDCMHK